jgi:hypothetical protein
MSRRPVPRNPDIAQEIADQIRRSLEARLGRHATTKDLADDADISHATAAKLLPPRRQEEPPPPSLPEWTAFKAIADALWSDQSELQRRMLALYATVQTGVELVPAGARKARHAVTPRGEDASMSADEIIAALGFVPQRVPSTVAGEANALTAILSRSSLGVGNYRVSKSALLALREGCCRFVAPAGRNGKRQSTAFFFDLGVRGPFVVNCSIALQGGHNQLSAVHQHERCVQISLSLAHEITVRMWPEDENRELVRTLRAGEACLVPSGWYHAASAEVPCATQLAVTVDVADPVVGRSLDAVAQSQAGPAGGPGWRRRRA